MIGESEAKPQKYKYDLLNRVIRFAVDIMKLVEQLPNTKVGNHIAGQLLRCGTSPAPNYAEAQGAESSNDFIHKVSICLKELRETHAWLIMIVQFGTLVPEKQVQPLIIECEELIRIFKKCQDTAKRNKLKPKNRNVEDSN